MESKYKKELVNYYIEAYGLNSNVLKNYIFECIREFLENADGPNCVDYWEYREYSCDIQLTNGDTLTEMDLDTDGTEAFIYVVIQGPNDCYSSDLCQLSIKDQLTILNAITLED